MNVHVPKESKSDSITKPCSRLTAAREFRRHILLMAFSALMLGCGDFSGPKPARTMTLFSVDGRDHIGEEPSKPDEEFQGYPVLGKVEIKDAERQTEILDAIAKATQDKNANGAFCFWPRHGLRVAENGEITEFIICFECHWIYKNSPNGSERLVTNRDPEPLLTQLLVDARVPVLPAPWKEDGNQK